LSNKKGFPHHPDYDKLIDRWNMYLLSYEGGQDYVYEGGESYLYRHVREHIQDFKFRQKRAVFESISQVVINVYQSHIRRKGVVRTENTNSNYKEFLDNCDMQGHNLDYFMLERAFLTDQIFGFSYIVIDEPHVGQDEIIVTEYDRKQLEVRPYLINYYPTQAINWKWSNGKFDWIIFEEYEFQDDLKPLELSKQQKPTKFYRIWTKNEWIKLDDKSNEVDRGSHNYGEAPVVIAYNRESFLYPLPVGKSAINTIAELDRKVFNLNSLLDEFLYRQCFVQLILDNSTIGKIIESGTTKVLNVSIDEFAPSYLEPPTGGAEFIVGERDRLISSAYQAAMIRGDNYMQQKQAESGVAKAYDLHDSNQNIAQKSKNIESTENEIHRLLKDYYGEVKATYPISFDIKTLNEELTEMIEVFKADIGSITYAREKAKKFVQKDFENINPELLRKIYDELDATNPSLSIDDKILLLQNNIRGVDQLIKEQNPDLSDQKIKERIEENKMQREEKKEEVIPEPTLQDLIK